MESIKTIIKEEVRTILENLQLADKIYFKTGKLTDEDKNVILSITNGDQTTKIISDMYYFIKNEGWNQNDYKYLPKIHEQLLEYNKNFLPVPDFDMYNKSGDKYIFLTFKERADLIDDIKMLPSIALRNLKNDFRIERGYSDLKKYKGRLDYLIAHIAQLSNRDESLVQNIYKKIFKSGTTLDQILNFVEDKSNLLGGVEFTKEMVEKIVENNRDSDLEIIYNQNNVMVVDVTGPSGIKDIGCNSLWCFTYGSGFEMAYRQWNNYSTNDHVYVIIDFEEDSDSPYFMYVLIKPLKARYTDQELEDNSPLYNMANEPDYDPNYALNRLVGKNNFKKLFTFEER